MNSNLHIGSHPKMTKLFKKIVSTPEKSTCNPQDRLRELERDNYVIEALITSLQNENLILAKYGAMNLVNLSLHPGNQVEFGKDDRIIEGLKILLLSENLEAAKYAAMVFINLTAHPKNQVKLGKDDRLIEGLKKLSKSENREAAQCAAEALVNLAAHSNSKECEQAIAATVSDLISNLDIYRTPGTCSPNGQSTKDV